MSSNMMYNRIAVIKACNSFMARRKKRIESEIYELREKYKKYRKHFKYFGRFLNDDEIHAIIEGKHPYYGKSVMEELAGDPWVMTPRERIERRGLWYSVKVQDILECATAADDPSVNLTMDDFYVIKNFYERPLQ